MRKAPFGGAFFILLTGLLPSFFSLPSLASQCEAPTGTEWHVVTYVVDGDTLRLKNGEQVRLIGIDTPELGRDGEADQPFAGEARSALNALVVKSGWRIRLRPGFDRRDRYRRLLAHAYASGGENLTAALLRRGVGYQAIVAPNLAHLACYQEAEQEARSAARGLWNAGVREASTLKIEETGYHLLKGVVTGVGRSRHAVWLELEGAVSARLARGVWKAMTAKEPEDFVTRHLELRGWFYRYKGALRVNVSHPASIHWL